MRAKPNLTGGGGALDEHRLCALRERGAFLARERQPEPPPFPEAESSGGTGAVRPDGPQGVRGVVSAPQGDGPPSTPAGPRPPERQPWDQQPGESARAFRRFLFYLHTGQQRTIRTAYL